MTTITGEFTRSGPCAYCLKKCTRTRTFTGLTMEAVQQQAATWTGDIWHRKCGLS